MPLTKATGNIVKNQQNYQQSDKGKETRRKWNQQNNEKRKKWKLIWATSKNGKASRREWYKKSPHAMYALYKRSAKKRNIEFNIEKEVFINLITQNCIYCNTVPPQDSGRNGLDRVNNQKGYLLGNIVPCCFKCNQMKGQLSLQEFYNHIYKIIHNQKDIKNAVN